MRRDLGMAGWRPFTGVTPRLECLKTVMLGAALNRLDSMVCPSSCSLWQERLDAVKPYGLPHKTYHSLWVLLSRKRFLHDVSLRKRPS